MRKLMWFTLGVGTACASCAYLLPVSAIPICVAVLAVACVALWLSSKYIAVNKRVFYTLAGLILAMTWFFCYDLLYLQDARLADGKTRYTIMTATDYSDDTDYGTAVDVQITFGEHTYNARAYLHTDRDVVPGDLIKGNFLLRYTASGGTAESAYNGGKGTFLLAYAEDEVTIVTTDEDASHYWTSHLRRHILGMIETVFPDDVVPFIKALLLGDTRDFDYETDTHLSLSGIRHVAAVSGLHVSILFSLVYFVTARRRWLSLILGLPCLLLFAALAGFSPSVSRACMMQAIMLLAMALNKEYDPPTALSFAALVLLLANPLTIASVSFQLSVGSVAGILLFSGRIRAWMLDEKRLGKLPHKSFKGSVLRKAAISVSVTLGAMAFTLPLSAVYFGSLSLVGVVTNLLCLWVITYLFCGIIVVCMVGIWLLPLAEFLASVLAWAARYVLFVSQILSGVPCAAVYTDSIWIVLWIAVSYILLAGFLLSQKKRPLRLLATIVSGLCLAVLCSAANPLLSNYYVGVLDVGQGQCVFLHSGGRTYMVDCGSDHPKEAAKRAAAYLNSRGIYRLDGVIVSHYDKDHVAAVPYLLSRVDTDVLILPEGTDAPMWVSLIEKQTDTEPIYGTSDVKIRWQDAMISVFSSQNAKSSNESSLCVLFQTEKCDILITGDRSTTGELELLRETQLPQLTALVVGHHGSDSSSGEFLLRTTRPQTAVISVGEGNPYGLPSAVVLQRLKSYGCEIRRTDWEGTVILRG